MFAFGVAGVLCVLLFPLNPVFLSVLLVFNMSISLILLILVFYLKSSVEISSFPTILLVTTLFRLSLNVASTKLILLKGEAGDVIGAFGEFVIGGNYIVGTIIFLILVLVNMMVIVKGSTRIAEVSARFTLDAMPGKQMSIDSDLNAGVIDDDEAKARRQALSDEAEFYGSMDGASKFVSGDAMAGLIITVINIVGGIAIGILQMDMDVTEALGHYTILTIGDGLVSQIPGLLISISAGMLVAKTASEEGGTGSHLVKQLFGKHQPLIISGILMLFLAIVPGFPFLPFMILATASIGGGYYRYKNPLGEEAVAAAPGGADAKALGGGDVAGLPPAAPGDSEAQQAANEALPQINPMTLEVGFSLVPLVDPNQDGDLVDRVSLIRKQIKEELGFLIPAISIQDNIELDNNEYRIMVRGLERARGAVHPGSQLAIDPGDTTGPIEGVRTVDPTFGYDAIWIPEKRGEAAEDMGYTVVDAPSVITTHVTKIVRDYAADMLSRQDVSNMLELTKETNAAVVEELVPTILQVGVVHRVLQSLLDEEVPIHDLPSILETLCDYGTQTKDPVILAEFARQSLKGHIISQFIGEDRTLYGITLDPAIEQEIQSSVNQGAGGGVMALPPQRALMIVDAIKNLYENLCAQMDVDIVLIVSPLIRLHMYRMIERKVEELPVLSYSEITDDIPMQILGSATVNDEEVDGLNYDEGNM